VDWEGGQFTYVLPSNSFGADWVIEPNFINQNLTDPTLMASRIIASITTATTSLSFTMIGLIAWNFTDPFNTPLELPDPLAQTDYDWIIRWGVAWTGAFGEPQYTHQGGEGLSVSQARRRLGNDKSILLVVSTDFGVTCSVDARCLLKE
jgi:hypothetical protein